MEVGTTGPVHSTHWYDSQDRAQARLSWTAIFTSSQEGLGQASLSQAVALVNAETGADQLRLCHSIH